MMHSNWDREQWREARATLAQLLTTDVRTPSAELFSASRLTSRLFERALMDLLEDGQICRHVDPAGEPTYRLARAPERAATSAPGHLSHDARAVHAYLRRGPNTARQIARSLGMGSTEVHRVLDDLERLDLVTFRYVGQLNIYRVREVFPT